MVKVAADKRVITYGEYLSPFNVESTAIFAPIDLVGGNDGLLVVTAPTSELLFAASDMAKTTIILTAILMIVAAICIVIVAKKMAKPIAVIRYECFFLASGDLRKRSLDLSSKDEIGQLATSFSQMR